MSLTLPCNPDSNISQQGVTADNCFCNHFRITSSIHAYTQDVLTARTPQKPKERISVLPVAFWACSSQSYSPKGNAASARWAFTSLDMDTEIRFFYRQRKKGYHPGLL